MCDLQYYSDCQYIVLALRIVLHSLIEITFLRKELCRGKKTLLNNDYNGYMPEIPRKTGWPKTQLKESYVCVALVPGTLESLYRCTGRRYLLYLK